MVKRVGLDQRRCSVPGLITAGMGDCLLSHKPPRYITIEPRMLTQLSVPVGQVNRVLTCRLGLGR